MPEAKKPVKKLNGRDVLIKATEPRTIVRKSTRKSTTKTSENDVQKASTNRTRKASSTGTKRRTSTSKKVSTGQRTTRRKKSEKNVPKVSIGIGTVLGIVAVILAIVFFAGVKNHFLSRNAESGANVPPGVWSYGIDISHNNEGKIVWDSLYVMVDSKSRTVRDPFKAKDIKPVSFVFLKATEGMTFVDKDFEENWKNSERAGLKRGAYHFFRSSKDGKAQAEHFIRTVGELSPNDLPPVLDIETLHKGGSKKMLNEKALLWLETVEEHYGVKPIVYANVSYARDYLSPEITSNYPIWIAHYTSDKPNYENWSLWQFTDKAVVKGVPGLVDLNVRRGRKAH